MVLARRRITIVAKTVMRRYCRFRHSFSFLLLSLQSNCHRAFSLSPAAWCFWQRKRFCCSSRDIVNITQSLNVTQLKRCVVLPWPGLLQSGHHRKFFSPPAHRQLKSFSINILIFITNFTEYVVVAVGRLLYTIRRCDFFRTRTPSAHSKALWRYTWEQSDMCTVYMMKQFSSFISFHIFWLLTFRKTKVNPLLVNIETKPSVKMREPIHNSTKKWLWVPRPTQRWPMLEKY